MNLIRINDELIVNLDAVVSIKRASRYPDSGMYLSLRGGNTWVDLDGDEAERLWDRLQYLSTPLPAAVATPDLAEIDETA